MKVFLINLYKWKSRNSALTLTNEIESYQNDLCMLLSFRKPDYLLSLILQLLLLEKDLRGDNSV